MSEKPELKCTTGYGDMFHYCPDENCEFHKQMAAKEKPKFSVERLLQAEHAKVARLEADLDLAIERLKDARGVIYTANQHLLNTYKDDYLSHQNQNNPVNRIDETLAKLQGEKK